MTQKTFFDCRTRQQLFIILLVDSISVADSPYYVFTEFRWEYGSSATFDTKIVFIACVVFKLLRF